MPTFPNDFNGSFSMSASTQNAGTVITILVPPKAKSVTRITELIYTSGSTAHSLTILRPIATTTIASAVTASDSTITLTAINGGKDSAGDAENLAAADWIAWEQDDGTFDHDVISSINTTTKVVTLTGTAAKAAAAGKKVWLFYEAARASQIILKPPVSTTTRFHNEYGGVGSSRIEIAEDPKNHTNSGIQRNCPLIVHSNNATGAGTIAACNGYYSKQ